MSLTKVFIESYPISEEKISGIGHMTLELIRALERHPDNQKKFQIVLVINNDRKQRLERWGFKTVQYKTIWMPTRPFNILWKFDLLPPMDIFLGKGTYIFPNYKNWRLLFSKSFTYVCDISYILYPELVSPKNQVFLKKNISKWVKRADKVLAISTNAQKEIVANLPVHVQKTLLVPCGVDTNVFYKRPEVEISAVKKLANVSKDYILFLGNIEPRKNITRLIEAYKLLPETLRQHYTLLLVGGAGWLNEPIMEAIQTAKADGYDVIKAPQYIPDEQLPALHSGASILVHAALYEGFGISPLQAMACGVPTLVAENSSMPEVVGDASIFVDAEDIRDISDKMERLLKSKELQRNLTTRGLLQAKKYTWEKSAQALMNEIIGNN